MRWRLIFFANRMLRLLALAAVCAIAFAQFDAQSEIAELRMSMEKRIELLEAKIMNGKRVFVFVCCVCAMDSRQTICIM